jgi:predicted phosphoribosyltransferase
VWFADRHEAGRLLAEQSLPLKQLNPVVVALPPGGVLVGLEVARVLEAELDLVLTEKIAAPGEPDVIVGAVGAGVGPQLVIDTAAIRRLDLRMAHVAATATPAVSWPGLSRRSSHDLTCRHHRRACGQCVDGGVRPGHDGKGRAASAVSSTAGRSAGRWRRAMTAG